MSTDKQKELAMAAAAEQARVQKIQEDHIIEVMDVVKNNVLPQLEERDESIPETKLLVECLAVSLNQAVYLLMKDTKVADLKMEEKISPDFPDKEKWEKMLESLKDVPLDKAIEALQWISQKADAVIKEENKERKFKDLGIVLS